MSKGIIEQIFDLIQELIQILKENGIEEKKAKEIVVNLLLGDKN